MSHFLMVVLLKPPMGNVQDRVSAALAPFQENNMGTCPRQYLAWHDEEDEYATDYATGSVEMVRCEDGVLAYPWDKERFGVPDPLFRGLLTKAECPAHLERVTVPFRDKYASLEEYVKEWHGRDGRDEEKRRYGYWENPNKKWDWWVIGGRWDRALLGDQHRSSDAPFEGDADTYGNILPVAELADVPPGFAVLTPDGEWIERGSMGWWAVVRGEKSDEQWADEKRRIVEKFRDCIAVAVDCHI